MWYAVVVSCQLFVFLRDGMDSWTQNLEGQPFTSSITNWISRLASQCRRIFKILINRFINYRGVERKSVLTQQLTPEVADMAKVESSATLGTENSTLASHMSSRNLVTWVITSAPSCLCKQEARVRSQNQASNSGTAMRGLQASWLCC